MEMEMEMDMDMAESTFGVWLATFNDSVVSATDENGNENRNENEENVKTEKKAYCSELECQT